MPHHSTTRPWWPTCSPEVEAEIQNAVAALTPTETVAVVTAARDLTETLRAAYEAYVYAHPNFDPLVALIAGKDLLAHLDADWRGNPEG
jgi:hypothetical protein